ncbi:substrate-binding domain-containing protein [Ostreibacterium oceani]|uniref:Phosphate ABC transporter substrate-binding protein n=1 Tax=Ostreibacterium oceani TaxID=2654998 RepID=A0A6N7EUY2_9GAMM|nr:substrate-binding domain-containing protein [Ostreibacterium oceani]MPV86584.1 phosphate ABC transporter substrate-binding protein [Ostreibacterium oceani]
MKKILLATALTASFAATAAERDTISIVGSSTVFPFATTVAENFGKDSEFNTPKIESTGSGGGMKLFCAGNGIDTPDVTNASRRMKKTEFDSCQENGVKEITEVMIGYDGIAIANSVEGPELNLTLEQLYLAVAKDVPATDGSETLVPNPYKMWSDIDASLPSANIEVLGPPPTSGTRDSFEELAMEGGCKRFEMLKALKETDEDAYEAACHEVRQDGHFIEAGENDNLIVQKLASNPAAVGVFGYSFLDENRDVVKAADIDGIEATPDNISDGSYPVSRSMYFYIKNSHVGKIPGLKEYAQLFMSEDAMGEFGFLPEKGLIPAPAAELEKTRMAIENLTPLQM